MNNLRDQFIKGMAHAAATVNVVTTDGAAGRAGVTVSAMSSVSADTEKPTLLVCVHHASPTAEKIIENGVFCVNVLRDDQSYISDTFAGRFADQVSDKFECANWVAMPSGAPRVADPLVGFDCAVISAEKIGTHYVFMGAVGDVFVANQGSPLVYSNRSYGSAWRIEGAASISAGRENDGKTLNIGCFGTFGPFIMPELIARMRAKDSKVNFNLLEGDQRRVTESMAAGQTEVALLYDLDLPDTLDLVQLRDLKPYVLLAADHPLAGRDHLAASDLATYPMVLLNTKPSQDYFLNILKSAGITPDIAYSSASLEMVRGLVAQGLGFSLLTTKPAADTAYDGKSLVSIPLIDAPATRVVLATRKGVTQSKVAQEFIWHCHDYFALDA